MERCQICNSIITSQESISRGMGGSCFSAMNQVITKKAFKIEGVSLNYNWIIKVNAYRELFLESFKEKRKTFRSEFKKSFFDSIEKSERVSKKQLDIIQSQLSYARLIPQGFEDAIFEQKKKYLKSVIESNEIKCTEVEIHKMRNRV